MLPQPRPSLKKCCQLSLQILLYLCLLVLFIKVYMIEQLVTFVNKQTSFTYRQEKVESIEAPTVTLCFKNAFKPSMVKKYGINDTYEVESYKINNTVYQELIYLLQRDFSIKVFLVDTYGTEDFLNTQKFELVEGLNEFDEKGFDVTFVHSYYFGLCTKIKPLFELTTFPLEIHLILDFPFLAQQDLPLAMLVYLTSQDAWYGVSFTPAWSHFEPTMLEIDLIPNAYNKIVSVLQPSITVFKSGQVNTSECIQEMYQSMYILFPFM